MGQIEKTGENFRIIYDVKGRFTVHRITSQEAKYKLCKVKEVQTILKQRLVKIDGQVRTDPKFPTGFMDVVQVEKTGENFRIIYDVKGRFTVHRITAQEAKY